MNEKYINSIQPFKCSVIFTYISDLERLYKHYQDTYYKNPAIKEFVINQMMRVFEYLKGYMCGLSVKHQFKILFKDDIKYECLSFCNNPSRTVRYTIFVCFNPKTFKFSYIRKDKNNGT